MKRNKLHFSSEAGTRRWFTIGSFLLLSFCAPARDLTLSNLFTDGMVLQRGERIPVWGWADPNLPITASINGKTVQTVTGADGRWKLYLPAQKAGGPYVLRVNGKEIRDILIGDVYLCSGQSNMELPVSRCMDKVADKVTDYTNHQVRYLKLPQQFNYVEPNENVQTLGWQPITPATAPQFGAVAYFTARYLQEAEQVPVGVINSSVGGTGVECWMSKEYLSQDPEFARVLQDRKFTQTDWVDSVRRVEWVRSNNWEQQLLQQDTLAPKIRHNEANLPWKTVSLFDRWASGENGNIYGSYWFRQSVELTSAEAGTQATLRLGAMKDADSVFVNGTCVGYTSYQYPPRIYTVPQGVLRAGKNEIFIKLMAQDGNPNFTQGKSYCLETVGRTLRLETGWQLLRGARMSAKPGSTYFVNTPTGLYNAMIAPLQDFPIRGAVWYQGENNTGMPASQYVDLFGKLTRCWRAQFGSNFPIVVVQLANFMGRHTDPVQHTGWGEIRLAQRRTAQTCAPAALATAIDIGEPNDIHPQQKDELGRRVALQLQRLVYGEKQLTTEGPIALKAKRKGNVVQVQFQKKNGGTLQPSDNLCALSMAGTDHRYVWVNARTTDDYTIELEIPEGMSPVSVRYAYDDDPALSIYNKENLPAAAFQLDVE